MAAHTMLPASTESHATMRVTAFSFLILMRRGLGRPLSIHRELTDDGLSMAVFTSANQKLGMSSLLEKERTICLALLGLWLWHLK